MWPHILEPYYDPYPDVLAMPWFKHMGRVGHIDLSTVRTALFRRAIGSASAFRYPSRLGTTR